MDTDQQGQEAAQNSPTGYQGADMQQQQQGQQVGQGSMEGQGAMQGQAGTQDQSGGKVPAGSTSSGTERRQERSAQSILMPPVDVVEDASGIILMADMPGVSKDKLNLKLEAHSLTIEGELSMDVPAQMESRYAEVRSEHYERTFALSRELDGEQATAQLAHGVLTVRIPKAQHAVPRKIPVNVG